MMNNQQHNGHSTNGDALASMSLDELKAALRVATLALQESRQDAMKRDTEAERYKAALHAIAQLGGSAAQLAGKALTP